jgi:CheY-like chemotaxis protein
MSSIRVLVADDDESIRHLLCTLVKRERLEVDCAADGVQAIEKLRESEYAVILLDLMMPRLDGFAVIEHLKNNPQAVKPVVLVITAYADQRFKTVDTEIVAGVIRKPFEVSEIGNIIRLCAAGVEDRQKLREILHTARDRTIRNFARYGGFPSNPSTEGEGNGDSGH